MPTGRARRGWWQGLLFPMERLRQHQQRQRQVLHSAVSRRRRLHWRERMLRYDEKRRCHWYRHRGLFIIIHHCMFMGIGEMMQYFNANTPTGMRVECASPIRVKHPLI